MSRVGKKPIKIPSGVKVGVNGRIVRVEGPLGSLSVEHRPEVGVEFDEKAAEIRCTVENTGDRRLRAYWGLTRALIGNMVEGVTKGYAKSLEVVGVGYTAAVQGQALKLTVGYANPIMIPIPAGVDVKVDRQMIHVKGADKGAVGQFAANVRAVRKPEPYQGKGIKYTDEVIRRKEGKQFGA